MLALLVCACASPAAVPTASVPQESPAVSFEPAGSASIAPTAAPMRQEGALDVVLLDEKDLFASVGGYRFTQGGDVELTVTAANDNGNPATIWFLFSDVNGWDVRALAQSTSIVSLAPGEEKSETIRFQTGTDAARFLSLFSLSSITLSVEGYVDSSDYEYTMRESVIPIPDAPSGAAQQYYDDESILWSNDTFLLAYLGNTEEGAAVFCVDVLSPIEGATCTLYPLEGGVYDTEKYLVPDTLDLSEASRRLLLFSPARGSALPAAFYAVVSGASLPPQKLTLPPDAAPAAENAVSELPVLAESELLYLRFDASTHRLLAENRTDDTVLLLRAGTTFTLDDRTVKANPQSILCFPGAATVFRVNGRGVDEQNVERNITIGEESRTLSAEWSICAVADGAAEPAPCGTIVLEDAPLGK